MNGAEEGAAFFIALLIIAAIGGLVSITVESPPLGILIFMGLAVLIGAIKQL